VVGDGPLYKAKARGETSSLKAKGGEWEAGSDNADESVL
jgi:hypothetical protein